MPDDLSFLDQLEEWLEAQVPQNFHEFPLRMLETMERMSNELLDTLNIHAPSSISIPFPPFNGKSAPPPPAPSCHKMMACGRSKKLVKVDITISGPAAALIMTAGLGLAGTLIYRWGRYGSPFGNRKKTLMRGAVSSGLLKEAIVLLSPSPMPPLLWTLTVTLLKAGYVVLVAVPRVEDAEALEKRLSPLEEKSALRVLIYDPEDPSTFPPFHRSLLATLTLRFPAITSPIVGMPATEVTSPGPRVHAFVSLYPLNPAPPTQPGALPALPTLLSGDIPTSRYRPMLVTMYPSGSVLVQPDAFASQILTSNHRLLGENLAASCSARIVSVFMGNLNLPRLHSMINGPPENGRLSVLKVRWAESSAMGKLAVVKDATWFGLGQIYTFITGQLGVGAAGRDYRHFERRFLRLLKAKHGNHFVIGQYSLLPFILSRVPPPILPRLLGVMPALPGATGPLHESVQGLPASRRPLGSKTPSATSSVKAKSTPASASSSDMESGEDLAGSLHSLHSAQSRETTSSASGNGLDESWAQVEN